MTNQKPLTREELRNLQSEIQSLTEAFEFVGDHVVITDANGNILYANKAVEDVTGFSHDEIIGKKPGDLWGGLMEKKFYEDMCSAIKIEKRAFHGEVQNRTKDGMLYWQQLRIFPIFGDDGEVRFFIGIEPDVSIRKALEGHQEQYIEEMERLNDYLEGKQAKITELAEEVKNLWKRLEDIQG
ncbi:MAG: PAS domain S-box protein [Patescibacteria group bacterium]